MKDLFARIVPAIESARVPYMLTGSVVSSLHGNPRSTRDLDVVIAPTREQLVALVQKLAALDFYADEKQAIDAFTHRSQFNAMDNVTGWKVDFIFREDSAYGRQAFQRQTTAEIADKKVQVSSPEDILIAKLRWAKMGSSDRQMNDVRGILRTQGPRLDMEYIEQWVRALELEKEWNDLKHSDE